MIAENVDKKGENYEPKLAKKIDEIKEQIKMQNDKYSLDDDIHKLHNEILINSRITSACYNLLNRILNKENLEKMDFIDQSEYDEEVSEFVKGVHEYEVDLENNEN